MRQIAIAASLALSACTTTGSWAPDYFEVSPFLGSSEFETSNRPNFETRGAFVTFGWNLQARRHYRIDEERHAATVAYRQATLDHRETMRDLAVGHLARDAGVSTSEILDALDEHDQGHENEPGLLEGLGKSLTTEPENLEQAWTKFVWIGGWAVLGLLVVLLHVTGTLRYLVRIILRTIGRRPEDDDKPS